MPYESRLRIAVDSSTAERDVRRFESTLKTTERTGGAVTRSMDGMNEQIARTRTVSLLASGALTGLAGAMSVREVIGFTDAWASASNQIRQVTSSSSDLEQMQKRLVSVAKDTRSNFESTAQLYTRLTQATTALGLSQDDVIGLTQTINQSFAVSGASAGEAAAAITQLSQALAAGALRGDEFNSISEQAPGIMDAIAESLQMTTSELREFAAEGGITAEIVVNALQDASESIDQTFGNSVETFGQKMEKARTEMLQWVGGSSEVNGAVDLLGDGIVGLSENIDTLVDVGVAAVAVYGARLTSSLATAAGGMVAAQAQAARYQATLASMAGVSRTAATAQLALGTATRGAAAAMGLIGGPAGAAILAGSAMLYFHEELTGVAGQAEQTAKRVDDLTNAINTNSEAAVKGQLVNLTAQMFDLEQQAIAARARMDELSTGNTGSGFLGAEAGRTGEQAAAIQELGRIASEMDAVGKSSDRLREIMQRLREEGTAPTVDSVRDLADSASGLTEAQEAAAREAEKQTSAIESLRRELDPAYAAQQKLARQTGLLDDALQSGALSLDEYLSLWGSAAQVYGDATDKTKELGDVTDETLDEMGVLWERTMERMDDAGVDMWRSFIDGTEDAFSSFKRLALDTLAEVIHAYTTRKITASLGLSVAGTGTAAAGGMGVGDLASMGSNLYNGVTSGISSIAWTGQAANAGGLYSNVATGGLYDSIATGGVQSGFMGGSMSNFGGMTGLASAGTGLAGGYLGTQLGSSLFGKEANSSWGATGGALIGTYFGGPLGSAIGGAIGGALDAAFGSGRDSYGQLGSESEAFGQAGGFSGRDVYGEDGRYDGMLQQSALGTIGVTKKQKTDDDALIGMVDAFVEIDNTLASVMTGAQLEQTRAALDGWRSSKTKNIGGIVDERLSAVVTATDSLFADALGALDGERLVTGLVGGLQIENVGSAMASAVAEDMNAEFRAALGNGSDIEAATQSILTAAQAVELLGSGVDRLGLQFDATATGALSAAGNLAELVGGLGNLTSLQSQYYQTFFSEGERFANLTTDLTEQFAAMGHALPDTREGVRSIVEGLDLMTEAGQQQYAALLQLVPSMDQYVSGMEAQRKAAKDAAQAAQEQAEAQRIAAQEAVEAARLAAQIQQEQTYRNALLANGNVLAIDNALSAYNAQLATIDDIAQTRKAQLEDEHRAITSLSELIDSLSVSDLAAGNTLDAARRQYNDLYQRAMGGDTEAAQGLGDAARTYLEQQRANASTAEEYARVYGEVTHGVTGLEHQFDGAVDGLDSIEAIEAKALAEQEKARGTLLDQLQTQVDIYGELGSIGDLLALLPTDLASSLAGELGQGMTGAGSGPGGKVTQKDISDAVSGVSGDNFVSDAEAMDLYNAALRNGVSLNEIDKYLPAGSQSAEDWAKSQGLPTFASGGLHAGGMRLVGERGPELEVTGPSRIFSHSQTSSMFDMSGMIAELKALRREVADLKGYNRQISESTGQSARIHRRWEVVGPPETRT